MTSQPMWSGDDYNYLMGRWSRLIAPSLVEFAGVEDGDKVLDVGCGTGSLTLALLERGSAVRVTGVDASENFIRICRENIDGDKAKLQQSDAQDLPFPDDSFDKCASLLVMNFIPNPALAVNEMKRVVRSGGTIAAAVWDYGEGMEMLRILWDEAAAMDENAVAKHERNMPLCKKGELAALWSQCGLNEVRNSALSIEMHFSSFEDYWAPFFSGIGPSGSYVCGLEKDAQAKLRDRLLQTLAGGDAQKTLKLKARAWAVRGVC